MYCNIFLSSWKIDRNTLISVTHESGETFLMVAGTDRGRNLPKLLKLCVSPTKKLPQFLLLAANISS